jgi:formylglycine-generating enzyme required for sulfatase activity
MYRPVWITIPAGPFTMGSDPRDAARPFANERPQQSVLLPEFRISRVPVTNAQYQRFVAATRHPAPGHWRDGRPAPGTGQYPVTYVSWADARAFCVWAGVRLPTEAEWEKTARGEPAEQTTDDGARWWPWGNALPDATRCHFNGQAQGMAPSAQSVMPVGQFPHGASPYGALDMAGNVWEWVSSAYAPYPYHADDGREDMDIHAQRVLRGGSFASPDARYVRCAMRSLSYPTRRREHIGFRVAQQA